MLGQKRKLIEWKLVDVAIIVDNYGKIIHNALIVDDPVIRQKYDDGVIVLRSANTGRLLVPPYTINERGEHAPVENWEEES